MILARAGSMIVVVSLAFCASTAQADVMVIDGNGARWVAGGPPLANGSRGDLASERSAINELAAISVPERVVADTSINAAMVPSQYADKIAELAERFDLSPALLEAVVWQESRWRANAISPAGARGLAQLMPATARELGVDPDDPMQNLEGGARYLREQMDRFEGDLEKALAAYNAGPARVARAGGIPNIYETKAYVAAVLGRLASHSRPVAP